MKFTNTLEGFNGETILITSFNTRKEAMKNRREVIKEFSLQRHAGHIVNYSEGIELQTNY
jgi:hypothetical protein